ncbi:RICIN domain-containing protein [Actinoplanes sp. NPDC026623]|uniref:RICIN domain-containing protein n=1 Tax=Actinoplanes sp. NPDC026623 TaxID=3155610 RepID=UPI0033FF5C59
MGVRVAALLAALVASATVLALTGAPAGAAAVTVTNATQFTDTTGAVVHAHGGGVIKVGGYYYWFGENRNADNTFRYVSAYRSTDLRTWEFRNHVLTSASAGELASANIERPKVIYNAATGQFVMWMHKETATDYGQARAAVAVSSTVDGAYSYRGSFRPLGTYMSRDITTFVDDDGTGYMVSAANENADLNVYRLTADYTGVAALVRSWPGDVREAPALFKRNGVYFMLTSGATGWSPNQQKYSSATSITGTWSAWRNAGDATAYGSQTAYVLPIAGTSATSYLYLGDRWGNSIGGTVNDSRYVWLPLRFPSSTTMAMDYFPSLVIDAAAGTVSGPPGSYVNVVARHSGKCLDVVGASTADNAETIQYACGAGFNQQWRRVDLGNGYVQLEARHSGKCLDVAGGSTADNARVVQFACGAGTNQQWQLQDAGGGYQRFVARHSGRCLDVIGGGTADGVRLIQYACGTGANQQWLTRTV